MRKGVTHEYFSAVTTTTLGYGDISPETPEAQLIAAFEVVSGIVIFGMFLNSLAHRRDAEEQKNREESRKRELLESAMARLLSHNSLINLSIKNSKKERLRLLILHL